MIQRSAIIIGSLFIPLSDIASYGLTRQLFDILSGLAPVYITTYIPLISKYRVEGKNEKIKSIYIKGTIISFMVFFIGFFIIYLFGENALALLGSETILLPKGLIIAAMLVTLLEMNHASAGNILVTKNEVPFFKPSIISGLITAILIYVFLRFTDIGLFSLFLAPGIVDIAYQSWKWPLEVIKDLKISLRDVFQVVRNFIESR